MIDDLRPPGPLLYLGSTGPGRLRHTSSISLQGFYVRRRLTPPTAPLPLIPEAEQTVINQECLHLRTGTPCPYLHSLLTCSLVQDTVVWGVVKVDKVSPGSMAVALAGCCEVGTILGGCHLHSPIIAPPQVITCAAEV